MKLWHLILCLPALATLSAPASAESPESADEQVFLENYDTAGLSQFYGSMITEEKCETVANLLTLEWRERGFRGAWRCREEAAATIPESDGWYWLRGSLPDVSEPVHFGLMGNRLGCAKVSLALRSFARKHNGRVQWDCAPHARLTKS